VKSPVRGEVMILCPQSRLCMCVKGSLQWYGFGAGVMSLSDIVDLGVRWLW
jgi:hypothetical protein